MLTMNEIVDLRVQQQIAHEIYRQQIMQRIPDPFPGLLSLPALAGHHHHHMLMPPRPTLPGNVETRLENNDLWQQFHKIGTEMIITKCGRRMFPSMRVSVSKLEEEANYCVLLEMVPIGDCRYKFSGSQWVPAGGAEPQSPQRMFLHPDSPASGAHWQAQPILFNKVKLTNNTLDSSGHVVLASMHKYQPRLHIIRTADMSQLPWAPQQAFVFPETEFVAVTAYQNDRITKLKIDNNPFAKGFRESGQSRCKRKLSALADNTDDREESVESEPCGPQKGSGGYEEDRWSEGSYPAATSASKRLRSQGSLDDDRCCSSNNSSSSGSMSPGRHDDYPGFGQPPPMPTLSPEAAMQQHFQNARICQMPAHAFHQHPHQQAALLRRPMDMSGYFVVPNAPPPALQAALLLDSYRMPVGPPFFGPQQIPYNTAFAPLSQPSVDADADNADADIDISSRSPSPPLLEAPSSNATATSQPAQTRRNNFSISAILAY